MPFQKVSPKKQEHSKRVSLNLEKDSKKLREGETPSRKKQVIRLITFFVVRVRLYSAVQRAH